MIIHKGSSVDQWHYVDTTNNPADVASRGVSPMKFTSLAQWIKGPDFLWGTEANWPVSPQVLALSPNDTEVKRDIHHTDVSSRKESMLGAMLDRYSDWQRAQRAVAWLLRLREYMKQKFLQKELYTVRGSLSVDELHAAINVIIKHTQAEVFGEQIKAIEQQWEAMTKRQMRSSASTAMQRLCPFMQDGLLRVGGRYNGHCYHCILSIKSYFLRITKSHVGLSHIIMSKKATLEFYTFYLLFEKGIGSYAGSQQ